MCKISATSSCTLGHKWEICDGRREIVDPMRPQLNTFEQTHPSTCSFMAQFALCDQNSFFLLVPQEVPNS